MTQDEALVWIANLFEEPAGRLMSDTPREDVSAWDSLGVLTLMSGLDSDFGIVLTDDEIQGMSKVNDILEIFRHHGTMT